MLGATNRPQSRSAAIKLAVRKTPATTETRLPGLTASASRDRPPLAATRPTVATSAAVDGGSVVGVAIGSSLAIGDVNAPCDAIMPEAIWTSSIAHRRGTVASGDTRGAHPRRGWRGV